ncbi:MAG: TrkH family potassium uptake protein [Syntrophaceae bacterium]|nr:TrkH family potassium uptake protein [Syntrophaceae bacterium]
MKFSNIAYTLSGLWLILALSLALPLIFSFYYQDGLRPIFIFEMAGLLVLSLVFRAFTRRPTELTLREGFLTVTLSWVTLSLFGSLPFMVSGFIPDFTDAFFETMSGFTTTGSSILTDIETLPKSLLLWRDMTQWLGGMGVIALAVAIFPYLGVGGFQLFRAEVPGPIKDKISPRVSETARLLWVVYLVFTVAQTLLLMLGGLSLFEALCTTFGTMATGGFHPRNASIAAYPSRYIQYTVTVFMFIAGVNFALHYWALRGRPSRYFRDAEFRFFLKVVVLALLSIMTVRFLHEKTISEELFRSSLFQTVSIVTTTGFVTEDYEKWPYFTQLILIFLMLIGGCTSSTGGAMKNVRVMILLRYMGSEIKKIFRPHGIFPIKIGERFVPENIVSNVMAFIGLYLLIFGLGVLALTGFGVDLETSIGSVAATLGNVGPGIGTVGPVENYAHIPAVGKWLLSFLMMVGRLEIYTVLVIFTRHFWD